jgi:hypothetical protein
MEETERLQRFLLTLERYHADDPPSLRSPIDESGPACLNRLPPLFQAWLAACPYDSVVIGGIDIAGSPNALGKNIEFREHDLAAELVPFGWSEEMGADLCFRLSASEPLLDSAAVVAVDHEDGRIVPLQSFAELLEAWADHLEDLIARAERLGWATVGPRHGRAGEQRDEADEALDPGWAHGHSAPLRDHAHRPAPGFAAYPGVRRTQGQGVGLVEVNDLRRLSRHGR